jgi:hypothetical protein
VETQVPLVVIPLASTLGIASQMPTQALVDYFGALGVSLRFNSGKVLHEDPTDHPDEVEAFCRALAPRPSGALHWPGVVVVGDMSVDGTGTNGALLDLDRRGVCAVFTSSSGFSKGDAEDRFEVYAHEIGHMLNLSHSEAQDKFPTAMHQWDIRSAVGDRRLVWKKAITQGSQLQRARLLGFFGNGSRQPLGLPMSALCCQWLAGQNLREIVPWGSHFKDPSGNGSDDSAFGLVDCRLTVQSHAGSVAQPVDFQVHVSVSPQAPDAIEVPLTLDLRSGLIEFYVTPPHSESRRYRTKSRTCGTARRVLEKNRVLRRNYTLLGDANGVLFPTPGVYKLEARLPSLGASSGQVEFYVGPAVGPFAEAGFQAFLAKDLPEDDEQGWRAVDEALQSRAVSPATKGFLRSKASARRRKPFMGVQELRREAAPRVQEKDVLLRVVRLRREPTRQAGELERVIDEAEQVLRETDDTNPSIQYLEHVRRTDQEQRGKEKQ